MNLEQKKLLTIILTFFMTLVPVYLIQLILHFSTDTQRIVTIIAIAIIAAIFWTTECIPIALTGLVIIILQGIFGIQKISIALSYIASPVNSIIFAGFVLASAITRYNLHKRLSLTIIVAMGERTERLLLGIMLTTAFLSMWISNTAATAIIIPTALGILKTVDTHLMENNLAKVLMIGTAYSASIGGMGTPIGTPACPIIIKFIEDLIGIKIGFLDWTMTILPLIFILILVVWRILLIIYPLNIKKIPGGTTNIKIKLKDMGALTPKQKHVLVLFAIAILLWISDSLFTLMSGWIYIASIIISLVFLAPGIGVVSWEIVSREINWGIFILVGGALALGSGLTETGVDILISNILYNFFNNINSYFIVILLSFLPAISILFFSSLVATASIYVPISILLARQLGMDPVMMAFVSGLSSCFAFLLPANTPPNAIAYGYGYFKTSEMVKVGILTVLILAFLLPIYFLIIF